MAKTVTRRSPNRIDVHVGAQLRLRRKARGFSQEALAKSVGLTFQQLQKYERGSNRISASKLYEFARLLECPVSYFFDGLSDGEGPKTGTLQPFAELAATREGVKLAELFPQMPSRDRGLVLQLVQTLADKGATAA